jgi:hypothetical protein
MSQETVERIGRLLDALQKGAWAVGLLVLSTVWLFSLQFRVDALETQVKDMDLASKEIRRDLSEIKLQLARVETTLIEMKRRGAG